MKRLLWTFCQCDQGQDVIEYALMAGLVAIAAGALMPNVSTSLVTLFNKIESLLAAAASY
jgi:pilus assembly protein Flp/PilA